LIVEANKFSYQKNIKQNSSRGQGEGDKPWSGNRRTEKTCGISKTDRPTTLWGQERTNRGSQGTETGRLRGEGDKIMCYGKNVQIATLKGK